MGNAQFLARDDLEELEDTNRKWKKYPPSSDGQHEQSLLDQSFRFVISSLSNESNPGGSRSSVVVR